MIKQFSKIFSIGIVVISTMVFFSSCEDEYVPGVYEHGVYVANEGGFGNNNGSISFYSYSTDEVSNNVFNQVNERKLGDVVQSISINAQNAFIVVNNSSKVEVVDKKSFKEIATISDLPSPRYIEFNNGKAYVSCWGDNSVKVINLVDYSVSSTIKVGSGPEKMVVKGDRLYVANTGGYGVDSTITVIDVTTDKVVASLPVKYSPKDMVFDKDGKLWVLSFGKVVYDFNPPYAILEETPSMIYKIDAEANNLLFSAELFKNQHPSNLEIDEEGKVMYFGGGYAFEGVYSLEEDGEVLKSEKIIDEKVYGLDFNSASKNLFVTVAPDFTKAGNLKRYNSEGKLLGEYKVGIGPNSSAF